MIPRTFPVWLTILVIGTIVGCGPTTDTSSTWIPAGGPFAREVSAVAPDPGRSGIVYAALAGGELFRSENSGDTWARIGTLGAGVMPYRFVLSADTPLVAAALTDAGIFVASPNKRQWTALRIDGRPPGSGVRAIAIDPWRTATWYVGTAGHGIYRSTDGGRSWMPSNGTSPDLSSTTVNDLVIDPEHPNEVLAAVAGLGLVLSKDQGTQWERLTEEFTATGSQIVRVFRRKSTILYATNSGSVNRSTDGGQTWSPTRVSHAGDAIFTVEASPWAPDTLIAGTSAGPILSTDFGGTWSDLSGSLPHIPCSAAFRSDARTSGCFVFGEAVGLQRTSDNGTHWEKADQDLGGSTIRFLATNEECSIVYAALKGTILTYDPSSGAWAPSGIGLEGDSILALSAAMESASRAIAATNLGGYKTTDGGGTWRPISDRLPVIPKTLSMYPRVKTRMLVAGEQGVFISTDAGATWVHSLPVTDRYEVRSFTFMPNDVSVVYAATANTASVISRDAGFHWEPSRYGIDSRSINLITLDDQDPAVAYAWTPQGDSYRTTNGGMEWNRYAPPWSPGDSVIIAADTYYPSKAVACVNNRLLYYTASGGGTWFPLGERDPHGTITALLWNETSGMLYGAVRHRGLFVLPLRTTISSLLGG